MPLHMCSSLAFTIGLGGVACVAAVLMFLLIPNGTAQLIGAVVVTASLGAFHFSSTLWGTGFTHGMAGLAWGPVFDGGSILIFVVLQGILSIAVCYYFSRIAISDHQQSLHEQEVFQTLLPPPPVPPQNHQEPPDLKWD